MLVNICMKFHEDTLNGFQVTERTRLCDGQTDGRTDRRPEQKQYISQLIFVKYCDQKPFVSILGINKKISLKIAKKHLGRGQFWLEGRSTANKVF